MKCARAKRANLLFSIVKYANLWRSCCRRCRGYFSFQFKDMADDDNDDDDDDDDDDDNNALGVAVVYNNDNKWDPPKKNPRKAK